MNTLPIGQRIQYYRKKNGLSQDKLAEAACLSASSLAKIERGYRAPSIDNFVKIANALNASADELLLDVLHYGYKVKISKLCEKLDVLPYDEKQRIITVMEAMINSA